MEGSGSPAKLLHISTDTIRPATHTNSTKRLELTPWDLNMLAINAIQKGMFFHKPKQEDTTWLSNLKTSLSRALDIFFPLAGRLATETQQEDHTMSVFLLCNNAGAEFVHATAELTLSDVLDRVYIPRVVHDFFPLNGSIGYDGRSLPLLAVQVTELTDGVFIGCTINHTIADGGTFWNFINSWSELCRSHQLSHSHSPPYLERWPLKKDDLPIRFPVSTLEKSIRSYSLPPLEERILHFAPQTVAKLKAKANHENKTSNNVISSLQAVLAHVWRGVTRARKYDSDKEVRYRILMGNRARLNPPLPQEYFGNSVNSGYTVAKAGELVNQGLGFAAGLLNEAVSSHTRAKICSAWEKWVKEPVVICFDDLESDTLITGSSPRFNMYGNDFGWGCPIGVRSGCGNKFDGKMTVYPGASKGSMEIEACLEPNTLVSLGEDLEFMEFVGVTKNLVDYDNV